MKEKLELRMFGFVPYQLMGIQSGIQFGHAVVDYGRMVKDIPKLENQYNDWADNWKTFIIYDGGNTNDSKNYYGTMQKYRDMLIENKIPHTEFREPDLGNQLLSVCFIADERVFNEKKYPNFSPKFYNEKEEGNLNIFDYDTTISILTYFGGQDLELYKNWVESIGGKQNLFLRKFRKNFKLAS